MADAVSKQGKPNAGIGRLMEARLFEEGTVPEFTTPEFYAGRESAPHIEEDAHRGRLEIAAKFINESGVKTVVDLGCGDGGLLTLLNPEIRAWGYDLQQSNVEASKARGVDVRYGDIVDGFPDLELGELAVTTELLEHLVDPHGYVKRLHDAGVKYLVASSPYTETVEEHYEFHAWCWDVAGYQAMLCQNGFFPSRTETWSMFQVHLAERA
jgi:SAM-dependent methyltransferase